MAAFRELPAAPFEACHKVATKVSSLSLVRYRTNDYSVPTKYGFRDVLAKGFVDEVAIFCDDAEIARHVRSYARDDFVFEPRHYLALLEQKSGALDLSAYSYLPSLKVKTTSPADYLALVSREAA